jgi:lipopolysaccharide biosynthesis protein
VTRATPLFVGHYQPHLPADLGFYDLRVRETRHEQIKMAKDHELMPSAIASTGFRESA